MPYIVWRVICATHGSIQTVLIVTLMTWNVKNGFVQIRMQTRVLALYRLRQVSKENYLANHL
jgi:hypothetical protein